MRNPLQPPRKLPHQLLIKPARHTHTGERAKYGHDTIESSAAAFLDKSFPVSGARGDQLGKGGERFPVFLGGSTGEEGGFMIMQKGGGKGGTYWSSLPRRRIRGLEGEDMVWGEVGVGGAMGTVKERKEVAGLLHRDGRGIDLFIYQFLGLSSFGLNSGDVRTNWMGVGIR